MSSILDYLKPRHDLDKYLETLEENGEVDISRLDIEERMKLVAMARKKGYRLDYKYPNPKTHDKVILVIKK